MSLTPSRAAARAALLLALLAATPAIADETARIRQAGRDCLAGERALRVGAHERARARFEHALATQPGFPNAHLGLGHVAMAGGEFERALEQYRAARDNFARFGESLQEVQARRYRSARSEITITLDQIDQIRRFSASSSNMLKIHLLENRVAQLLVVEPPDPDDFVTPPAEHWFYIGNALFQLGRLDEAVAAWEACRDAKPAYAMVHNNLALAYWKQGRLGAALAAVERATALGFPVNPEMRAELERASADERGDRR